MRFGSNRNKSSQIKIPINKMYSIEMWKNAQAIAPEFSHISTEYNKSDDFFVKDITC